MKVGRALFDGAKQHLVNEFDDGGVGFFDLFLILMVVVIGRAGFEIAELFIIQIAEGLIGAFKEFVDGVAEFVLFNQNRLNIELAVKAQLFKDFLIGGVRHTDKQPIAPFEQGKEAVLANQFANVFFGDDVLRNVLKIERLNIHEGNAKQLRIASGDIYGTHKILLYDVGDKRNALLLHGLNSLFCSCLIQQPIQYQFSG